MDNKLRTWKRSLSVVERVHRQLLLRFDQIRPPSREQHRSNYWQVPDTALRTKSDWRKRLVSTMDNIQELRGDIHSYETLFDGLGPAQRRKLSHRIDDLLGTVRFELNVMRNHMRGRLPAQDLPPRVEQVEQREQSYDRRRLSRGLRV